MKRIIVSVLIFSLFLVLIPASALIFSKKTANDSGSSESLKPSPYSQSSDAANSSGSNPELSEYGLTTTYKVLDITTDEVVDVSARDYVIGAVAAEMPSSFEAEALKAQAVAAHTYAERRRINAQNSPDISLKGADFSNDSSKFQAFFTHSQIKEYFGVNYPEKYAKISNAADSVLNEILTYKGEPIIAAFHSISSGTTESAANAWGGKVDYLIPVDSEPDKTAPKYRQDYTFSINELRALLMNYDSGIVIPETPPQSVSEWFDIKQVSASRTIIKVIVGGKEISGENVRSILGLRSAAFTIDLTNGIFTFTSLGYGHGVGMSQYGANEMAKNGAGYAEILEHYYPNSQLTVIST